MNSAVGIDPSWSGLGWCAATNLGPVACGHVNLDRTWRWAAVEAFHREVLAHEVADLGLMRNATDPPPFLIIERPPPVYNQGKADAAGKLSNHIVGNQAHVGYGLGLLAGAFQLWWVQRGWLGYPWEVEPRDWRTWWKIGGRGRGEKKLRAIRLVESMGWGRHLAPFPRDGEDYAPCGDVAESILIAVGGAQHARDAPAGPRRAVTFLPPANPKPRKSDASSDHARHRPSKS